MVLCGFAFGFAGRFAVLAISQSCYCPWLLVRPLHAQEPHSQGRKTKQESVECTGHEISK